MSIAGKVFKNNVTGSTIKVIDSFENIAILENKQKIDVKTLMDTNQYTEQIDPSSFFNNQGAYNILAEKIKNIPTHMIQDEDGAIDLTTPTSNSFNSEFSPTTNESAIVMTSEEDEKAELARKYGVNMSPIEATSRQNEAFAKLLGEEAQNELPQVTSPVSQPEVIQVEATREEIQQPVRREIQQPVSVEDPIITMFKKTKRNVEFKISVDIVDKIPRLDFIEMMEDSYETSMIDFLADEFTNKILQDPSVIRNAIKDKIKQLVYGGDIKSQVNNQITDAVTQVKVDTEKVIKTEPQMINEAGKKTTTRKPRTKKETSEK